MEQKILRILLKNYTKIPYKGAIAKVIFDDCFEEMAAEITELVNENDFQSGVIGRLSKMIAKREAVIQAGYLEEDWRSFELVVKESRNLKHAKKLIEIEDAL
jgi:hypothetical protein